MPGPKDLDPSSSPRALLGAELRHAREKSGLSQEELGARLFVSGSFIGQLESGTRRMQPEYARLLDDVLDTEDFFRRNCTRRRSRSIRSTSPRRRRRKGRPGRSKSMRPC